jgi:uncharacterized membrane protein
MANENTNNDSNVTNKAEPSKLRFIDLIFIIYYAVAFVCFLLNYVGVTHYYETYFNATWFVFPLFIQLLATRLLSFKEILFSKFPLSFKSSLRNVLILQFLIQHAVVYTMQEYPNVAAQVESPKTHFLICNALLFIWAVFAIYQKSTSKKNQKEKGKK